MYSWVHNISSTLWHWRMGVAPYIYVSFYEFTRLISWIHPSLFTDRLALCVHYVCVCVCVVWVTHTWARNTASMLLWHWICGSIYTRLFLWTYMSLFTDWFFSCVYVWVTQTWARNTASTLLQYSRMWARMYTSFFLYVYVSFHVCIRLFSTTYISFLTQMCCSYVYVWVTHTWARNTASMLLQYSHMWVATVSRIDKIIDLFCERAL